MKKLVFGALLAIAIGARATSIAPTITYTATTPDAKIALGKCHQFGNIYDKRCITKVKADFPNQIKESYEYPTYYDDPMLRGLPGFK